jgi:MFS family permease
MRKEGVKMSTEAQSYIDSKEKQKKLYKHTLIIVSISQIFGGAGLAAGIAVGALLAQQMLGTNAFAGIPATLFTLGSAVAAFIIGRLSQRYGRRNGLTAGFMAGGIGAIGVMIAAITNSIVLLLVFLFIYGTGTATNLQTRYAGTDLAAKNQRATAISVAMVSTTIGAFAGPNLVNVMGNFALTIGIPKLAGPFILSGTAYIIAALVIFIFLRPDPYLIVKAMEAQKQHEFQESSKETDQTNDKRGISVGLTVMILTQMVMIAVMTMTPVHMEHHGHGLAAIGLVIGIHIGSMYLPSLVTGILVDKIGRTAMAVASGVTLLLAGLLAATAPTDSLSLLIAALALLGLGWNFGLISGTAIIVDSTQPSTRAKTQGTVDVFIAIAGASGGAMSGLIVAGSSYATLSFFGGFLSLLLVPVMLWSRRPVSTERNITTNTSK